jgi:hypothetical protein
MTDLSFTSLSQLKNLEKVCVPLSYVSDTGVKTLLTSCPKLTYLDVTANKNISLNSVYVAFDVYQVQERKNLVFKFDDEIVVCDLYKNALAFFEKYSNEDVYY